MTHKNITKDNLLLNINLEVKEAFKTDEDLKDDWRKNANKYQVKISYFGKSYVTDYYMGSALTRKPNKKDVLNSMLLDDVSGIDFNEFCNEFGYDNGSTKSLKIYIACQRETKAFYNMFDSDEIDMLRELLEDY